VVSMPTIRSRILKRGSQNRNGISYCSLNANDPFEDTETAALVPTWNALGYREFGGHECTATEFFLPPVQLATAPNGNTGLTQRHEPPVSRVHKGIADTLDQPV